MALVKCSECGKEISEYSYTCPHCGKENASKKALEDIEIEDDYESRYFTYAKQKKEADIAAQKAKEKVKAAEEAAKEKHKKLIRRIILIVVICVAALVICLIAYNISQKRAAERAWEEQVQTDENVLSVIENSVTEELINGKLPVSDQMQYYFDNGVSLFGGVEGQVKVREKLFDENELWQIEFESEEVTVEQMDEALTELEEIYGEDYEYEGLEHSAVYNWYGRGSFDRAYIEFDYRNMKIFMGWGYFL